MRDVGGEEEDEVEEEDTEEEATVLVAGKSRRKRGRAKGPLSKHWEANKAKLLEGFQDLPGALQLNATSIPERILRDAEFSQRWLDRHRPVVTMDMLRARLPTPVYDDVWSEDQEKELLESFPVDGTYRVYVSSSQDGITTNYESMWRKICRLRGCFPEQIIGAKNYLEYGEQIEHQGVWRPNPNWTKNFCKALEELAICSPCDDNMDLLGLFIRYAVACSMDDRRRVPVDNSRTAQPFFDVLQEHIQQQKGAKSLKDLCHEVRTGWANRGLSLPWEALVLVEIERLARPSGKRINQDRDGVFKCYPVLTDDLKTVSRAFSSLRNLGLPKFPNINEVQNLISYARSVGDAPKTMEELFELRVQLVLDDMRIKAKRQLEAHLVQEDNEEDPFADTPDPFSVLERQAVRGVAHR